MPVTGKKRQRISMKSEGLCWYCGISFEKKGDLCIDHQDPVCRNGSNDEKNLVASCRSCNSSKGAKNLEEYRAHYAERRYGMPRFTDEQKSWLIDHGFQFPKEIEPSTILFWGESTWLCQAIKYDKAAQ